MKLGNWLKQILARLVECRLSVAVASLLTVLLGLVALLPPIGDWSALCSYDAASLMLPQIRPKEVLIVYMDEHAHGALNQSFGEAWDRSLHARLLDKLRADQARLAVFDVFFREPGEVTTNALLADAMRKFGPVLLAATLEPKKGLSVMEPILPLDIFRQAAAGWGSITSEVGPDEGVRKHCTGTELLPSLAWMAAKFAKVPLANIEDYEAAVRIAKKEGWPPPPTGTPSEAYLQAYVESIETEVRRQERWLRYYGPSDTIEGISYDRALEAPPGFFKDKYIFIGGKPAVPFLNANTELYCTPYTWTKGSRTPGVEINATAFLNLLNHDWLERSPLGWEIGVVLLGGLLFSVVFRLVSPVKSLIFAAGLALAITLIAWFLIKQKHLWFAWLIPVGIQIPSALLCAVAAHTTESYHRRRIPILGDLPLPAGPQPVSVMVPDHALLRCLQRSEQGEVWLAKDTAGAYRAVKLVQKHQFEKADAYKRELDGLERFMDMARSQAGFVQVYSIDKQSGYFHCIVEAADDEATGQQIDPDHYSPKTLAREINRRGRLPPVKCLEFGLALSQALEHAHQRGFLHLNVRPPNIIFVNGHPKLVEVAGGIAKRRVHFGSSMGMEGYVAPDSAPSPAADVYSLGMVLYVASTGMTPERFPEPPSQNIDPLSSELINDLNRIISVACSRDLERRFKSAAAIHAELLLALSRQLDRDREVPRPGGPKESESVGGHRLLRRIGQGAFGEVWLGRNQVGLYHAVKIVSRDQFSDADPYEREFEGLKHFMGISRSHPGFVQIHHVDRNDDAGYFFYVMEAGDDEALAQKIDPGNYRAKTLSGELSRRGPLPPLECLSLMVDLSAALAHLHRLGLIHRDIKPSNIIYVNHAPKLADIGLVTNIADKEKMTIVGTMGYMAPEGPRTAASDVYSMGIMLYTTLTKLRPDRFPELSTTVVDAGDTPIMNGLIRIMFKACEVEVKERYPSATELHEDLRKLFAENNPEDRPTVVSRE